MRPLSASRSGFTLAEVMVTIMIVSIGLVLVLQGLSTAKITAAHTHNRKVARGLALLTLGQIESGLYWEDMDERLFGSYAEEGYEAFQWEVAIGDETLTDLYETESTLAYDSWQPEDQWEEDEDEDEDEESAEPFEKVRIRVTFPKFGEFPNEFIMERWMPWEQVHGSEEDTKKAGDALDGDALR